LFAPDRRPQENHAIIRIDVVTVCAGYDD
jgi:hypothetical protein